MFFLLQDVPVSLKHGHITNFYIKTEYTEDDHVVSNSSSVRGNVFMEYVTLKCAKLYRIMVSAETEVGRSKNFSEVYINTTGGSNVFLSVISHEINTFSSMFN